MKQKFAWRRSDKADQYRQELMGLNLQINTGHFIELDFDPGFRWGVLEPVFSQPIAGVLLDSITKSCSLFLVHKNSWNNYRGFASQNRGLIIHCHSRHN